jgi:hypothetical protein
LQCWREAAKSVCQIPRSPGRHQATTCPDSSPCSLMNVTQQSVRIISSKPLCYHRPKLLGIRHLTAPDIPPAKAQAHPCDSGDGEPGGSRAGCHGVVLEVDDAHKEYSPLSVANSMIVHIPVSIDRRLVDPRYVCPFACSSWAIGEKMKREFDFDRAVTPAGPGPSCCQWGGDLQGKVGKRDMTTVDGLEPAQRKHGAR